MAELIDVDEESVTASTVQTTRSTVDGGSPAAVPTAGLASLLDATAFGLTTLMVSRVGTASGSVLPLGPIQLANTTAGLATMSTTETASAAKTAAVQLRVP